MESIRRRSDRSWLWALLLVAAVYSGMQLLGITCPIKFVTGISCPGCGMTRAWLSLLLRHDLAAAFRYHPLFWVVPPAIVCLLLRRRIPPRHFRRLTVLFVVLLVAVYLVRMAMGDDPVVVFQPERGVIPRGIHWIAAQT